MDYEYVIWDNFDDEIHRGPWTEDKCLTWMDECRDAFPRPEGVDEIWSVRRAPVQNWETY